MSNDKTFRTNYPYIKANEKHPDSTPVGGAGVLGGAGTGATHTDLTDILIIPIRPTTPATDTGMVTMAMMMGRPAMITDLATRLRVPTAAITAARTKEMTIPPIQKWPSCNADLRRLGITLAL
jgi:hypothetical protein